MKGESDAFDRAEVAEFASWLAAQDDPAATLHRMKPAAVQRPRLLLLNGGQS